MRSLENWEARTKSYYLSMLSPRIQRDLAIIPTPINLPQDYDSLYIYGPKGSGKTIYAAQLLIQEQFRIYMEDGPKDDSERCEFVSMPDLMDRLKNSFHKEYVGPSDIEILNHYQNLHLLVLDDFGTIKPTDWAMSIFYSLLNYRYEYLKKTIITSNLSLVELIELMEDDRLTSRIERSYEIIHKKPFK